MSIDADNEYDADADDVVLPIKRTDGDTMEERLTGNAYHNILPARYLNKDADGEFVEEQENLFRRVGQNIALAEAVFEAGKRDIEITVTPDLLKPDHPRRDELAAEVFGAGTTAEDGEASGTAQADGEAVDDAETTLTADNVNKFAYETLVPELPDEIAAHVEEKADEFQDLMEQLSFMPNSPTLMNAGDELQQLSACFVDSPGDDLTDIHQTAKEAAEVFQCLTADATVRVAGEGTVSIADVGPGDEIVQRKGDGYRTKRVEEVHAYDDAPTRRLETESGIELTGTPNHRLLVDGEWTELDDVSEGDAVSVRLGWLDDEDRTVSLETVPAGAGWADARTVSNEAIASLHAEGLSDYEIAERLDSSPSTVQRRRADELGLEPNGQGGRSRGRTFDEEEFESLYEEGHTDAEMAEELGVTAATVGGLRRAREMETNGEPVKTVTQPGTLTEELAELVGVWIGDGSVHQDGIRFHVSRESVLETLDRRARDLFDTGVDWTWADGCYEAVIHSHEIKRWWLANFGDAKPSSAEARVPEPVERGDRSITAGFLRGLFTADGTLTKQKYPRLYSASEELIDDVTQLLLGVGIPANKWDWTNEERDYFSVAPVGCEGLESFAERVGFLDDRTETLRTELAESETRPTNVGRVDGSTWEQSVATVEDAGEDTVYDVTVADDPEYVANGLVSHNSGGGMGYAFWQLRPFGDPVGSTGGIASGPMTFMETFDQMCFPPGTDVLTPQGQRPIETLRKGDLVIDENGDEQPVVETMEREVDEEIIEIVPERLNEPIRATGEHPFKVARDDGFEWVDAGDLADDDLLVLGSAATENGLTLDETLDLSTVASGPLVFTDGGAVVNREHYGAAKGPRPAAIETEVPVSDFATVAGWYLAEGCVVYRRGIPNEVTFTLHADEEDPAAEITDALDAFGVSSRVEVVEERNTRHVHAESASLAQLVEGLFGTGASQKRVPDFLWDAPVETQARVIEALFDGDGTLQKRGKSQRVQLQLVCEEIIDWVFQAGLRCGVQFSRHSRTPEDRQPTYWVSASVSTAIGTPLERLFDEVPESFRAVDRTKRAHGHEVVAVDEVRNVHYEGPVYNAEVADTHTYVAEDLVVHNCETIAQGGARRGAQMGVMRVSHPDVIEFLHAKNKDVSLAHTLRLNDPDDYTHTSFSDALEEARELIDEDGKVPKHLRNAVEGHLSNFNISVGITDDFMEALEAGEEFTFTNPRTGEPHIATEETREMYGRYGLGEHVEPGEELSIDPQLIWDRIVEGAHENGEPGVIYLERVNKQHSFDVEEHPEHRILATNPSLAAGTKVLTDQGVVGIEELEGDRFEVPTLGGEWADAVCHQSGANEPLYEVELSNGKSYLATEEHKWPVLQDEAYERTKTTEIEPGDHLPIGQRDRLQYGSEGTYDEGMLVGWLYGDGSITERKDGRTQYGFIFSQADADSGMMDRVLDALESLTGVEYEPTERQRDGEPWYEVHASNAHLRRFMSEFGVGAKEDGVPDALWRDASESFRKGFVDGLFSADGYIDSEQNRIILVSSKENLIKDVSDLLGFYGLKTSLRESESENWGETYDRWDLKLSRTQAHRFRQVFELSHEAKAASLRGLKTPDRDNVRSDNVVVEAVRETDERGPVWDLRVDEETHTFALSQVFTGNCGEQPLEEYEACNLGHINLSTLAAEGAPDWRVFQQNRPAGEPFEESVAAFLDEAIDWAEFDRRIELGTRFLENVVTMSDFPVPEIEAKVREMRKIGLGIMGLAQLYIQLGIRYGSDAGNEVARQLMTHINHGSKAASHELATERGSFAEWDKSKYADPTEYREWFEHQTGEDAAEFKDGFKIRNHNTTTIAPTGTTSMVGNTTGGCEPIYNVAYYKNVSDDVQGDEMLVEFDDYFLRVLEANDIDVDAVKAEAEEQMAENAFDGVEGLDTVPDAIGELFVVTSDLSGRQHAAVQCACQEGVDSAISKCIEEGTLVQTDQGLVAIEEFSDNDEPGSFSDVDGEYTIDGYEVTSHYYAGEKPSTRIRLDSGAELVGATESHRVLTPDGWELLADLEPGDTVLGEFSVSHGEGGEPISWDDNLRTSSNPIETPDRMTPEFAEFLGMIAADGGAYEETGRVEITTDNMPVEDRYADLCDQLFGAQAKVDTDDRTDSVRRVYVTSRNLARCVRSLIGDGAYAKHVPKQVIHGNAEEKLAFVRGLTLDGYNSSNGFTVYEGMAEELAYQTAQLLRSFGVPKVYEGRKWVSESEAYAHQVTVSNELQDLVRAIEPHKNPEPQFVRYKVPVDAEDLSLEAFETGTSSYYAARSARNRGNRYLFNETAEKLGIEHSGIAYEVTEKEDVGKRELYDIEVEESHRYLVNGMTSHNTCNFPNSATPEDMDEVYRYIYQNGGKGVTVYRDGTRSKQVLTTRAENTEFSDMDESEAAAAILDQIDEAFGGLESFLGNEEVLAQVEADIAGLLGDDAGDLQPRPDTLHGVSQRVTTGYGKLYVTINEDPETGQPFEVFANIGHSGGYTNSFTEALGKVISTALRAGVDPEEIVDELRGTRSPKVAWDKGEQINSIPDAIGTALNRYIEDEIDKPYPKQTSLDEAVEDTSTSSAATTEEPEPPTPEPETDGGAAADAATGEAAGEGVRAADQGDTQSLIEAGESPECPDCGGMSLYFSEGCKTCESCGWSEC